MSTFVTNRDSNVTIGDQTTPQQFDCYNFFSKTNKSPT